MSKADDEKQDDELGRDEKLRMENEIEKLKLSAFHDATFFEPSDDLSPEVENEWLKYIAHFEKEWEDVERITIAEKLGYPEFPAVEHLSEAEIEEKLDEVQRKMAKEGIFLDTICEVPDAEIYRFITKELFEYEIDDMDIEGMQTSFIYEEFYPNAEYDIEQILTDFIIKLFNNKYHSHLDIYVAKTCRAQNGEPLSGDEVLQKSIAFSELYERFEIDVIKDFQINIDESKSRAGVHFYCKYLAITSTDKTLFEGEATAVMEKGELGYWNIAELKIPGFAF